MSFASVAYVEMVPPAKVESEKPNRQNRMDGQTKAADIALSEWGRWMRNADKVLGWPTAGVLGRVKIDGLHGAAQANAPTIVPEGVMVTDAAIAKLGDIRKKVLKIAYMHHPEAPSDVQRRYLRMSRYRWNLLLREARFFVAMQLGIPPSEK